MHHYFHRFWHRFTGREGGAEKIDEEEEESDGSREETSVEVPPGLSFDCDGAAECGEDDSPSSSPRHLSDGQWFFHATKQSHERHQRANEQQPTRGKFLKRSETAPRPSSASGVGHRLAEKCQRRPISATPAHSEGEGPHSAMENLASRLSRRSSIISDLVALMVRRSSSFGKGRHSDRVKEQSENEERGEENELDEEEETEEAEDLGNMPREKILQKIRRHKEIIGKVRLQPWPMKRKRRALKVARQYLQRQEAQVSKWNLYKAELSRRCNQAWRWAKNLSIYLIPWESKIKQIESNFGSVVSSYFIFLRWVLGMNITTSFMMMLFVVVPEWLADSQNDSKRFNQTRHIKVIPQKMLAHADELNTVLDFGGYLQYSYLFYGFYSSETVLKGVVIPYNVPVAYFCVNLFLLVFSIFIILKKMTSNARKSKLSSGKQEQYVFTWKVVNGWDYNLGESETASSLAMANVIKLKEASTEYNKKFKQKWTFQTFFLRVFVNFVIMSLIGLSMLAIWMAAQITEKDTFIKQNAVSITVALITLLFPPVFELILKLEQYRPRTALRIHLFRVLIFYLINYFTLVAGLFTQLNTLEAEMRATKEMSEWNRPRAYASGGGDPWGPAPYGGAFQIRHSLGGNRTFYEVFPVQSNVHKRPFFMFASFSAEKRREKRQFVQKRKRLPNRTTHGKAGRRRKRPSEQDTRLNVMHSSKSLGSTPSPGEVPKAWTTVQPHFGPFNVGVHNAKVIVAPSRNGPQATIYESRPIGPSDVWASTDVPKALNYTSAPKTTQIFKQPYRTSNYDDLCWETLIGQEIAKIVTTDLVMTVAAILVIDFLRGLWIRYCSDWWCWDIESTFPEYGEFKVAENVLHLVNSQGMVCLGTILVPMLPLLNCVKLVLMMYIRAWACMVCNVPAKQIFRASRSSNFYFWLLLMMLCISTLPVGFVIASKEPSKNCGPFAGQKRFFGIIGAVLKRNLNQRLVDVISYLMSPGIVIPVLLLMFLIIYFLVLLVNGLRAANSDLNKQLTLERTEEKRKIFELAKGRRGNGSISHQYKASGESGAADAGGRPPRNGAAMAAIVGTAREGLAPLYLLKGETKKTQRKSWHGSAAETEGIPKNGPKRHPFRRQHSDESRMSPQSPSKSPLRHTPFLPSLQSVHENEEDESQREGEADEAPPATMVRCQIDMEEWVCDQQRTVSQSLDRRQHLFSWKDRLLICIGWKLRNQAEEAPEEETEEGGPLLKRRPEEVRDETTQQLPEMEEADYSVPSDHEEEVAKGDGPEAETNSQEGEEANSENDNGEQSDSSHARRANSARTSQCSWVRPQTATDGTTLSMASTRAAHDADGAWTLHHASSPPLAAPINRKWKRNSGRDLSSSVAREFLSEYSPFSSYRPCPPFFDSAGTDLTHLSLDKRHPFSPFAFARAQGHLPPLGPKSPLMAYPFPLLERRSSRDSVDERLELKRAGEDEPSLGTRAPSEESLSLPCLPPTPTGYFRPILNVPAFVPDESLVDSDPRLQYANPYSSYAAAMCCPISPQSSPLFHSRMPSPSESSGHFNSDSVPPLPRHGSIAPFPSPSISRADYESIRPHKAMASSKLAEYSTPIQLAERRQRREQRPEPIYDQPVDEGGSTSGRGTIPPGYGSSPRSSPESYRPRYRISSMSPGHSSFVSRMGGTCSDQQSPQRRRRHFDIRQRSGLGLGHSLATASPIGRRMTPLSRPEAEEHLLEKQSTV